ncbi:MAG: signal peptidase I [Vulcanimicrobiaceae bacterium]
MLAIVRIAAGSKALTADARRAPAVAVLREWLDGFIVVGLVALFLATFVIRTFYIPSISMIPTLHVGDIVLVDELSYRLHPPRPGEIAVFMPPIASGGDDFVKRVIGVPGDTISIRHGIVYRNGRAVSEPYINQAPRYNLEIAHYTIYVDGVALDPRQADIPPRSMWQAPNRIPRGFYFVLGDNRNYSDDSHVWGFAQRHGPFAAGPLKGTSARARFAGPVFCIFWPLHRFRILS